MTTTPPAAQLRDALAALATPGTLARDELLDALTTLGGVQAVVDAVKVRVVGELVARSRVLGEENPVLRVGHASPAVLVAERWQIPVPAARQYCAVGEAIAPRVSLIGEMLPAQYPVLAEVMAAPLESAGDGGRVSVEQAAVILRELSKAAPACTAAQLSLGERVLVETAPDLTVTELRTLAGQVRDRLDQDGILPREQRQHQRRSLTITTTSEGMTHVDWYLDPESAAYVVTAIDAVVGNELRTVRFRDPSAPDFSADESGDLPEPRSMTQLRSDAATDIFRHYASCTTAGDGDARGKPPVTVIVRIGLDALQAGVGMGEIDGLPTPISAGTVRRMAADATIIPAVLGGASEVLDLGRGRRLFNKVQKFALAERDGGCAWSGCPHPPAYTEAHHIRWWNAHGGGTDLSNGVLLCSSHHHRVHADGWDIRVHGNTPYFIPPDHVDPYRRPRRGGRTRITEHAA